MSEPPPLVRIRYELRECIGQVRERLGGDQPAADSILD